MTCIEHYFENLILHGEDVANNANRNALTEDEREAVEACADYVIYVLFGSREAFNKWRKRDEYPCSNCMEFDCAGCEYKGDEA